MAEVQKRTEAPKWQWSAGAFAAEALKENGVEVAFGVYGGHIWSVSDEMSRVGIKLITVRHEQTAAYAAEAYAKVTGKPGVAFGTAGPGGINMSSAVQQAYLSCSPVVLLIGGLSYFEDGTYTLQQGYTEQFFHSMTKWVQRLIHPAQYKHFVSKAFNDALAYPPGPVALEFSTSYRQTPIPSPLPADYHNKYVERWRGDKIAKPILSAGDPALVENAVKMIYEAKQPIMYAADGVHWSGGEKEVVEFAELAQIPTTGRRIARGSIPENHPLFVANRVSGHAANDSDLFVTLGQKTGFFEHYGAGWPKCIQINDSPLQIWTFLKTAEAIVGSPKLVLRQMINYVKAHNLKPPPGRAEWVKHLQDAQNKYCSSMQSRAMKYKDYAPVHHAYLSKVFWDYLEERYDGMNRIVLDGYTISNFASNFLRARYSGQIMDSGESAGVGHSIGMTIGAALGDPEMKKRPAVALLGDGGLGLGGMDIETAARYRLPIVFLVTNNNGWLTGRKYTAYGPHYENLGPQDREYGCAEVLPDIRYDKIFEEMGCHGEWVTEPAQIRPALERAFTSAEGGKPAVLNIKVEPSLGRVGTRVAGEESDPWDPIKYV